MAETVDTRFTGGPGAHAYRVRASSPAIDAGVDYDISAHSRDLAGAPRLQGAEPDRGAFEFDPD